MDEVVRVSGDRRLFRCPGCGCAHFFNAGWTFNGDPVRPTIRPSILVTHNGADGGEAGSSVARCHSFVTDGQIQYLADTTHALSGETVPLTPWDEKEPNA